MKCKICDGKETKDECQCCYIEKLQQEIDFLRKRENKLQMIEQMFKSGSVDLGDLAALVEEK